MATTEKSLPSNEKVLVQVIDDHMNRESLMMNVRSARWKLASSYLSGCRRFRAYDPRRGTLLGEFTEEDGKLPLELGEMLSQNNRVLGALEAIDISPVIKSAGIALTAQRERAVADILLDAALDMEQVEQQRTIFNHYFAYLGFAGIHTHVDRDTRGVFKADLEVVPPWEIFPFPASGRNYANVQGVIRQRWVTLAELTQKYDKGKRDEDIERMDAYIQEIGQPHDPDSFSEESYGPNHRRGQYLDNKGGGGQTRTEQGGFDEHHEALVRVREFWQFDERGNVLKHMVCSGTFVFSYIEYDASLEIKCPLRWGRFMENGTFYGAGIFDMIFSQVRFFERAIKQMIDTSEDMDRYPITIVPSGVIEEKKYFKEDGRGLKMAMVDPDAKQLMAGAGAMRPFTIAPHDGGIELPGTTAEMLKSLIDQNMPTRDLMREKGRVDSLADLQFLDEADNRTMSTATKNKRHVFSESYRTVISMVSAEMLVQPAEVPVYNLHVGLAGAVINFENGTLTVGQQNPIPDVSRLKFMIRHETPKMENIRKREAVELLASGVSDLTRFTLLVLEEGLDFAMWMEPEKAAWQMATINVLTLFGDGQSSGQIVVTPEMARPDLQLEIVTGFMMSPIMSQASATVVDNFQYYVDTLKQYLGVALPASMPDPLMNLEGAQ